MAIAITIGRTVRTNGYRYGYAHRAPAYHYGHRVLRRYY